jgi:hypothetical protein
MSERTSGQGPASNHGPGRANGPASARVILACEMIEDEVRLALEGAHPDGDEAPPVVWIESGLHERPERLQKALQAIIDILDEGARTERSVTIPSVRPGMGPPESRQQQVEVGPVGDVLLAFGFCGKGLQGLGAAHVRLVFPRVDDCISLFLNHGCVREEIPRDAATYYLTQGWLSHESSMTDGFGAWVERYGEERARDIRRMLFATYENLALIDTGAYEIEDCLAETRARAEELELALGVVSGSVQLLDRLFAGPWDGEVVVVPPGERISLLHLMEG